MTNHDSSSRNARHAQRQRQQNTVLLAIAVTFVLLLLVFAILLCMNVVMALKKPDVPKDDEQTPPVTDDQTPEEPDNETPDEPTPPVQNYQTETVTSDRINQGNLLLVNKTHVYTFPSITLVNVYNSQEAAKTRGQYFQLAGAGILMEQTAYQQMDKLLREFGDPTVVMTSAHRTAEQQTASGSSTPAGYSDSHTGLSCALRGQSASGSPISLSSNEKYNWLYENCYKYGFVVRYPDDKTAQTGVSDYNYYFRYVGYVHAYLMKTRNLCLEEYITLLKNHTYGEQALKVTTDDGSSYEIYYVRATSAQTQVPIPDHGSYTISGDNEGGFIVTVKVS